MNSTTAQKVISDKYTLFQVSQYPNRADVLNMTTKLAKLLELQTTVDQTLIEVGENATIQMKILGVIVNKASEQACQWVSMVQVDSAKKYETPM